MRAGPARRDYRFSDVGADATQYWSVHPLGPLAETLRWRNIRSPEFASELRTRLWAGEFDDDSIVRVTFDSAEAHGIAPDDLVGEDYGPCRQWAGQIRKDVPGIVVPSAALPGTENLVLFGPRVRIPYGLTPLDSHVEVPADPTAEAGQPPLDLLRAIRWRGATHAGLEAWKHGSQLDPPTLRYESAS